MQKILFAFTLLVFAACGNSTADAVVAEDSAKESSVHAGADPVVGFATGKPFVLAGCYTMIFKKDTTTLSLAVKDTLVSGKLAYHIWEKDKNTGTIKGKLQDSLIIADYTFQSEGTTSVREVIFKIKDSTLVEAFGDVAERDHKLVFSNPSRLQYMDQSPFVKIDCKE
jgi:hypothetical protein